MITISGGLVIIAIGLLASGMVFGKPWLFYAAIAVCLASAVCLVVGVFTGRSQGPARGKPAKRRTETDAKEKRSKRGSEPTAKSTGRKPESKSAGAKKPATTKSTTAGSTTSATDDDSDELDAVAAEVVVVPGRLRYHLYSCRQASGRDTEELTVDEARSQGYVACTSCRPDSVLAARAEASANEDAADEGDAEEDVAAEDADEDSEEDSADAADDVAAGGSDDDADASDGAEQVVMVVGGRRYHLAGCQVIVDAREDDVATKELTVAEAHDDALAPCTVCGAPKTV